MAPQKHPIMKLFQSVVLAVAFALAATEVHAATVMVFAAASLTDALKEIAASYEKQSSDKMVFNFAASGALARQIEEGAPADIFFSADEARADALEKKGLLVKETRKNRLSNTLAIVVPFDSTLVLKSAKDLGGAGIQRLALGDAKTVPVGSYSKAYLEKLGIWSAIQPKVVPCESVRSVLAAVESGNIDAGIVYKTDAAISKKVKIAFAVPRAEGPQITYPMALVKDGPQPEAARKFLAWLDSAAAGAVFAKYGFELP
jgi:molybdate transport system substrate-binding protein